MAHLQVLSLRPQLSAAGPHGPVQLHHPHPGSGDHHQGLQAAGEAEPGGSEAVRRHRHVGPPGSSAPSSLCLCCSRGRGLHSEDECPDRPAGANSAKSGVLVWSVSPCPRSLSQNRLLLQLNLSGCSGFSAAALAQLLDSCSRSAALCGVCVWELVGDARLTLSSVPQPGAAEPVLVQLQQSACEERGRPSQRLHHPAQPQRLQGEPEPGG